MACELAEPGGCWSHQLLGQGATPCVCAPAPITTTFTAQITTTSAAATNHVLSLPPARPPPLMHAFSTNLLFSTLPIIQPPSPGYPPHTSFPLPSLVSQGAAYRSCAVVGSSGSLLMHANGAAIDSHEAVFRFNAAPTAGYERHVGSRTTHRLTNLASWGFHEREGEAVLVHTSLPQTVEVGGGAGNGGGRGREGREEGGAGQPALWQGKGIGAWSHGEGGKEREVGKVQRCAALLKCTVSRRLRNSAFH